MYIRPTRPNWRYRYSFTYRILQSGRPPLAVSRRDRSPRPPSRVSCARPRSPWSAVHASGRNCNTEQCSAIAWPWFSICLLRGQPRCPRRPTFLRRRAHGCGRFVRCLTGRDIHNQLREQVHVARPVGCGASFGHTVEATTILLQRNAGLAYRLQTVRVPNWRCATRPEAHCRPASARNHSIPAPPCTPSASGSHSARTWAPRT